MSDYSKRKIEITCWRSGRVLFAHEAENNTMRLTVGAAVNAGANLGGANLVSANLGGANLVSANLSGAYLSGAYLSCVNLVSADLGGANLTWADLTGANLTWADLTVANLTRANLAWANLTRANLACANLTGSNLAWANLTGANLTGADLYGADLRGAYLYGEDGEKLTLVGSRPILQIGPIGSEWGTLITYLTDQGIYLSLGCFFGTREQFAARLADTHHDNIHASEYAAALALVDAHAELWTPTETEEDAA